MTNTATHLCTSYLRAFIVAGAIAFGAALVSAPIVYAQPESEIKSECADSDGRYTTTVDSEGHRTSTCCYENIFGITHCDVFKDGAISDGDSFNQGPAGPTKAPVVVPQVPPPARQG
jgi:hypothetical protein